MNDQLSSIVNPPRKPGFQIARDLRPCQSGRVTDTKPPTIRLGILSDMHYASAAEQARGNDYESQGVSNRALRFALRCYRHHVWLRDPLSQGYLVDRFLKEAPEFDHLVAGGDYSCDSAAVGVSDDASCASVRECLGKLRGRFGERLHVTWGDHELGKVSFFGGRGGMRLASYHRAVNELKLAPFWRVRAGNYVLMGVVSSLLALPVLEPDALPEELPEWQRLRAAHLDQIRGAFAALRPGQRVLLFCHDPTALPYLGDEPAVREKLPQLEQTIIGHLHSNLVFWKSQRLSGLPRITFLGHTARRLSSALREGRRWRPFKVRLCPALAGIQLLKDGGYLSADLDPEAVRPAVFRFHPVAR
jgi:hypothetical protein